MMSQELTGNASTSNVVSIHLLRQTDIGHRIESTQKLLALHNTHIILILVTIR